MGRKSLSVEPEKPHRLSLAELAAHDDACSDAMVDNAYFKSQIRKNRTKYNPLRGIKQDEVPQILLHKVIVDKNPLAAEKALLQLVGLKRYRSGLRSQAEKDNFLNHLRKYIMMYMTDCSWEVSTTNRYTITTFEAAVTARQRVKQGQVIKYLVGTLVPLTIEESADLDLTNRNFSIVVSSRKKHSSIFLGPARFANHDCDANGRLVTRGTDGMEVVAVKNIEIGDEITVSYGDDYFGPGNMDCLCHTCERLVRNGWVGAGGFAASSRATSVHSINDPASPEPSRNKRKRGSESTSLLRPSKLPKIKHSPSKLHQSWTPPASGESDTAEEHQVQDPEDSKMEMDVAPSAADVAALSPPTSPHLPLLPQDSVQSAPVRRRASSSISKPKEAKVNKLTARLLGNVPVSTQCSSPVSFTSPAIPDDEADPDTITIKMESIETNKLEKDSSLLVQDQSNNLSRATEPDVSKPHIIATLTTIDITKSTVVHNDEPLPSIEPVSVPTVRTEVVSTASLSVQPLLDTIRVPGDYLLTRKLLAQPHDRWVQCHNERCLCFFLQPNGYQTRRECPRCERHSMLYGFSWPKTDPDPRKIMERASGSGRGRAKKAAANDRSAFRRAGKCGKGTWVEGGGDEEERVMDHRIVHRFVLPEDEKAVTRKGLLKMAEMARVRGEDTDFVERSVAGRVARTESIGLDSDRSLTPDGEAARRRSNRFVAAKVYTDI